MFRCQLCSASFAEAGFCPTHGVALVAVDAPKRTTAGIAPHAPIVAPTPLAERPAVRPHSPSEVRAISAANNAQAVLASMTGPQTYEHFIGQLLDGRYLIERKLGEGGMGVVFGAKHNIIERKVAIKVLRREAMREAATIKRFEQEAKAATRVGHPNIVDVIDFGMTPDGMVYQVMEYLDGVTLAEIIREQKQMPLDMVLRIVQQIARALSAAHDKGIVHRDLKPDNLFLIERDNRRDFIKVVDFGIAKVQPLDGNAGGPRLTRVGSVFGTPEYMAPEQASGRNDTDGRVDIYALGVIMYQMVTGVLPHKGESAIKTIAMQILDTPASPRLLRPDLPEEFERVILTALAKKREARYQTMQQFEVALENLLTVTPTASDLPMAPTVGQASNAASPQLESRARGPSRPHKPTNQPPLRARTPSTGYRGPSADPEFTAAAKPVNFEQAFDGDVAATTKSRVPWAIGGAVAALGLVAAVVMVTRSGSPSATTNHANPGPGPHVPTIVAVPATPVDAAPSEAPTVVATNQDAALRDAAPKVAAPKDARPTKPTIASTVPVANVVTPNGRGTYTVKVIAIPNEATIYVNGEYRGPAGVNLEMPAGSKATITCSLLGYTSVSVPVVFDGKSEDVLCKLTRQKLCASGLHDPLNSDCVKVNVPDPND